MSEDQLRSIAESLNIKGSKKMDRAGLGFAILDEEARLESQKPVEAAPKPAKKRGRPSKKDKEEKPAEKPAEKPVEKKTGEKPEEKPAAKPAEKPAQDAAAFGS